MAIPSQHTFDFRFKSDEDDQVYSGTFTVKRPTIGDRNGFRKRAIYHCDGRYYDFNNPGQGVDMDTWTVAVVIARLESCFVSSTAPWFDQSKLWEFHDFGVLHALWEEVLSIDDTIFRGRRSTAEKDSQAEFTRSEHGGAVTAVVDEQVPAAVNI